MASIYKRDGKWRAEVNYKDGGKYKKKTKSGFKTKAEANAWAADIENLKNTNFSAFNNNKEIFVNYFHEWYTLYKSEVRPSTLRSYSLHENWLRRNFPDLTISELNRSTLQQIVDKYSIGRTKGTVKAFKEHISAASRTAFADGLLRIDPTVSIVNKGSESTKDSDDNHLNLNEIELFLDYIEREKPSDRHFVYITALLGGLRFSEITGLRAQDIDAQNGTLTVNVQRSSKKPYPASVPKTKESIRTITMPKRWFNYLARYRKEVGMDSEFIIPTPPANEWAIKKLRDTLIKIGAPHMINVHGLRHTHVSWLLSQGVDLMYISKRVGHKNTLVTQTVYAHMLKETSVIQDSLTLKILEK